MKLVFYSGGFEEENLLMDQALVKLVDKKDPLVTFIPAAAFDAEIEFREFVAQYSKYGFSRFMHFTVDNPFDKILLSEVLKSDVIHMGGGNTFHFLNSMRKSKLLPELKKFVEGGGVLSGLSAGAIMMTEDIDLAGYPDFDHDENEVGLKNLSALALVDFAFFPHFQNTRRYIDAFYLYSKKSSKKIYACPDGSGLVVDGDALKVIGKSYLFYRGKKTVIN